MSVYWQFISKCAHDLQINSNEKVAVIAVKLGFVRERYTPTSHQGENLYSSVRLMVYGSWSLSLSYTSINISSSNIRTPSLADLRGAPGTRAPPGGPNSFIFMQFSGTKLKNNSTFGSWRPPWGKS